MSTLKLIPIRFPSDLIQAIDRLSGPGKRTAFLVAAARREVTRQTQLRALDESAGAWGQEGHEDLPDTVDGFTDWMRDRRRREERRSKA